MDQPLPFIFGFSGELTTILGHVVGSDGKTYDPYVGDIVELSKDMDTMCTAPVGSFAARGQAMLALSRGQEINAQDLSSSFSPTLDFQNFIRKEWEIHKDNRSWPERIHPFYQAMGDYMFSKQFKAASVLNKWTGGDFVATEAMGVTFDFLSNNASDKYIQGDMLGAALGFASVVTLPIAFAGPAVGASLARAGMASWSLTAVDLSVSAGGLAWDLVQGNTENVPYYADDAFRAAYSLY
jgi:hypothetical protein